MQKILIAGLLVVFIIIFILLSMKENNLRKKESERILNVDVQYEESTHSPDQEISDFYYIAVIKTDKNDQIFKEGEEFFLKGTDDLDGSLSKKLISMMSDENGKRLVVRGNQIISIEETATKNEKILQRLPLK